MSRLQLRDGRNTYENSQSGQCAFGDWYDTVSGIFMPMLNRR